MHFDLSPHRGKYDLVYADCAWPMYGDPEKNGAAGKHYDLMTMEEICAMDMKGLLRDPRQGAFFIWATCPRLHLAFKAGRAWGLEYRGVAFNWVKTRKDGGIIGAQGVPPTSTKPTSELCLFFTTNKAGRPFPLLSSKVPQVFEEAGEGEVVYAQRQGHSVKPDVVRSRIVELFGDRPRIELFSRHVVSGWDRAGNQILEQELFKKQFLRQSSTSSALRGLEGLDTLQKLLEET